MKKMALILLILGAFGLFAGCTHTEKTATGGAIAGAAVGAMLGNDARSTAIGAGIGGALGAGAGELTKNK